VVNFQAHHSNGIPSGFVDSPGVAPGTTAYGGNDGGAVIRFSNGLTVYLTADTGLTGDMETIIRRFYGADLVVINMGDVFSMGPEEAAFAINTLLKPRTVIPSHINEAATSGGLMVGARLQRFSQMLDRRGADIVLPLSGVIREFDGHGRCQNCKGQ
jgi:L-ascorbate metabolism protein UlaG (beta-lactamase superfamily)